MCPGYCALPFTGGKRIESYNGAGDLPRDAIVSRIYRNEHPLNEIWGFSRRSVRPEQILPRRWRGGSAGHRRHLPRFNEAEAF